MVLSPAHAVSSENKFVRTIAGNGSNSFFTYSGRPAGEIPFESSFLMKSCAVGYHLFSSSIQLLHEQSHLKGNGRCLFNFTQHQTGTNLIHTWHWR